MKQARAGAPVLLLALGCASAPAPKSSPSPLAGTGDLTPVVVPLSEEPSPYFVLHSQPFCFLGANNYFLAHEDRSRVTQVLESAKAHGFTVLRTWGFLDRGSLDGKVPSVRPPGHQKGVYFQAWDTEKKRAVSHDGSLGLARLDFALVEARRLGLKLLITLTNNWRDFGGMDQYLTWYGLSEHRLFYTDERVKQAYKDWVFGLLTRENSLDGTPYREDPAVFAWELANEPRAQNGEDFDSTRPSGTEQPTGTEQPSDTEQPSETHELTSWAREMSAFVKSVDPRHMVSVGDEGFLQRGPTHLVDSSRSGVDHEALTALPHVDFGTYHLYPDHWQKDRAWGRDWIKEHLRLGRELGKPEVLEEYGVRVEREGGRSGPVISGGERRSVSLVDYGQAVLRGGGAGALFWMFAESQSGPTGFLDYDGFTIYPGEEAADVQAKLAADFRVSAQACRQNVPQEEGPPHPFVMARPPPEVPAR